MEKSKNPKLPVRYVMYAQEAKALIVKAAIPRLNNYNSEYATLIKVA